MNSANASPSLAIPRYQNSFSSGLHGFLSIVQLQTTREFAGEKMVDLEGLHAAEDRRSLRHSRRSTAWRSSEGS
jgi:hypothetical protein